MESEDALTGDFGRTLLTEDERIYRDPATGHPWLWRVSSHKLRSGGRDATERLVGADGIVQLVVSDGEWSAVKGLLFQAKKNWRGKDRKILEQCKDLAPWRSAAMIFNYRPSGYEAYDLDTVVASGGVSARAFHFYPMEEALGAAFLECERGGLGIFYDPVARDLIWPSRVGLVKGSFAVANQFRIDIAREELPRQIEPLHRPRLVRPGEFRRYPLRQPRRTHGVAKYPDAFLFRDKRALAP